MKKILLILLLLTATLFAAQQGSVQLTPLSYDQVPYPMPVKKLTVDGYKVAYVDSGSQGEAVLFLHGWSSSILGYAPILGMFKAPKFRAIALDYIGNGRSDKPDLLTVHSIAFKVKTAMLLLKHLGIKKAHIAGHSMGGVVSSLFALTHPDMTSSIILLGPAGMVKLSPQMIANMKNSYENFAGITTMKNVQAFIQMLYYKWKPEWNALLPTFKRLAIHPEAQKIRIASKHSFFDMLDSSLTLADKLPKIKAPVLVILGKQDKLIPGTLVTMDAYLTQLKKNFKKVKIEILNECGHVMPVEQPSKTANTIMDFILGL